MLDDIDGDDEEPTSVTDLGDDFGGGTIKRPAFDDVPRFTGVTFALALDDLAREDDVFEVEDRGDIIFEYPLCLRVASGGTLARPTQEFRSDRSSLFPNVLNLMNCRHLPL